MNKKSFVIPWLGLSFLLMGMLLSFCSAFRCTVSIGRHFFLCLLIAGIVSFPAIKLRKKYVLFLFSAIVLGIAIYAFFAKVKMEEDFLSFVYYINARSMDYSNVAWFGMEGIRERMDENVLLLLLEIFLAMYIAFFAFCLCSRLYGLWPVYVVPMLGLCVGVAPDKKTVFLLGIGMVLVLSWISGQERGGRHSFAQKGAGGGGRAASFIALILLLGVGFFVAELVEIGTNQKILSHSKEYLKRQHKMEQELVYKIEEIGQRLTGKYGLDSDGRLSNTAPVYMQDTMMELTLSQKPVKSLYLTGFVGGSYQNGRWSACETKKFQKIVLDEQQEQEFLSADYFLTDYFYNNFWKSTVEDGLAQLKIEYTEKGKQSKYAYVPYCADISSIVDDYGNACVNVNGENGLLRKSGSYVLNYYNLRVELPRIAEQLGIDGYSILSNIQLNAYEEYVKEVYGSIPPNELSQLKSLTREYDFEDEGAAAAAQIVKDILAQRAGYSQELEPVPEGADYVEYFLYTQKKGYCEHFATAGTLMLRSQGIPARYVSGYKISPSRFLKNEDGTYTARVLDSDAHAWTEVYLGMGGGWFPVEMTPGTSTDITERIEETANQIAQEEEPATEKPQATAVRETEKPTATPKALAAEEKGSSQKKTGGKQKEHSETAKNLWRNAAIILLIVVLLILLTGRVLRPRMIRRRYDRELLHVRKDKNTFIRIRTGRFLFFLKHCGIRKKERQNEYWWIKKTADFCGYAFEENTWGRLKEIVQEAEYSKDSVTDENFVFYCKTMKKAEHIIYAGQEKRQRRHLWMAGLKS